MTLFHDPDNYTGGFDVEEVLHLATDFDRNDPTNGLVTDDEIPWFLVGLCITCAVVAPLLGVVTVQVARHWIGCTVIIGAAVEFLLAGYLFRRLFAMVGAGVRRVWRWFQ